MGSDRETQYVQGDPEKRTDDGPESCPEVHQRSNQFLRFRFRPVKQDPHQRTTDETHCIGQRVV